jgi:hypothetical protein
VTKAFMLMVLMQSIYVAIFNNINGNIIEKYSYKTFYFITMMISLFTMTLAIFRLFYYRKKEKEAIS